MDWDSASDWDSDIDGQCNLKKQICHCQTSCMRGCIYVCRHFTIGWWIVCLCLQKSVMLLYMIMIYW